MKLSALLRGLLVVGLISAVRAEDPRPDSLAALNWILGNWETGGDAKKTREDWTRASEATYEGVGYDLAGTGAKRHNESLRIVAMGGEIFYLAKVGPNPLPIAFKLTKCDAATAVFKNSTHDFPRKISYARVGDAMTATVEGSEPGDEFTIQFTKAEE